MEFKTFGVLIIIILFFSVPFWRLLFLLYSNRLLDFEAGKPFPEKLNSPMDVDIFHPHPDPGPWL